MKARKVGGLEPSGTLADNLERIVRVRTDELFAFMPRAADPGEDEHLHDMRIAAKRLRYILEISEACFGPYAAAAAKRSSPTTLISSRWWPVTPWARMPVKNLATPSGPVRTSWEGGRNVASGV